MLGIVYKLRCKDDNVKEFYIGSSMNIKDRMIKHKSSCDNPKDKAYNYKVYIFIRANGGYQNWNYDILEECEVEDKDDLVFNYERKYILELDPQLNMIIVGRTIKEWCKENKEKVVGYTKKYREKNKEIINEKQREKFNCECGGKYIRVHKLRHEKSKKHIAFINK